jgi:hypothetical protein
MAVSAWGVVPAPQASYQFENNLDDSSGNGYHAVNSSGTIGYTPNPMNGTMAGMWPYNSDFMNHDYATAPNAVGAYGAEHDPIPAMTIAFAVKVENVAGHDNNHWIVYKEDGDPVSEYGNGYAIRIDMTSTRPYFHWWDDRDRTFRGDNVMVYGQWAHWTLVWRDGGGQNAQLEWYHNGVLTDQAIMTWDNIFSAPNLPTILGSKGPALGPYEADEDLAGDLDCLKFWGTDLSPTEVMENYQLCLIPEPASILLLGFGFLALRRRR